MFDERVNAEKCSISGALAYAHVFVDAGRKLIQGWYGSTVADMTILICFDDNIPLGPISDAEIYKGLDLGTIAYSEPYLRSNFSTIPPQAIYNLIDYGVTEAENMIAQGGNGRLPFGDNNEYIDPLAYPFTTAVTGFSMHEDHINFVGIGHLLAMVNRLRNMPLEPGDHRSKTISATVDQMIAMYGSSPHLENRL